MGEIFTNFEKNKTSSFNFRLCNVQNTLAIDRYIICISGIISFFIYYKILTIPAFKGSVSILLFFLTFALPPTTYS